MGAHEMGRNIDAWQWSLFIPRVCTTVFGWFRDALALQGLASPDLRAEWTPPARTLVDPAKEYNALLTAVKAGFMTLPEAIRQQGYDPDAVLAEQAEYLTKLDAAGVMVESDYRHKAASLDPTITEALTGATNV
jgi:capsid protein